jgi:hypothetical protein
MRQLTSGRHWRLYYQQARSRSEEFLEPDLATLAGQRDLQADLFSPERSQTEHFLCVFYLLFGRTAFLPQPEDTQGRNHGAMSFCIKPLSYIGLKQRAARPSRHLLTPAISTGSLSRLRPSFSLLICQNKVIASWIGI